MDMHSAESILPSLSSTGMLDEINHLPQSNTAKTRNLFFIPETLRKQSPSQVSSPN